MDQQCTQRHEGKKTLNWPPAFSAGRRLLLLLSTTLLPGCEQHGTSEQFHSELKSDLDLERLPSGKFATNALMLSLGLVAYNLLRLCGQTALAENADLPPEAKMPVSKPVFRRRRRNTGL